MTADDVIQDLTGKIYIHPLSTARSEPDFPNLANPLHLVILLIDCDTEILMNGMLGFLENMTGRHLASTIEALKRIGALAAARDLQGIQDCMARHGVTWERLRGDLQGTREYDITSFHKLHGAQLAPFASEVTKLAHGFSPFRPQRNENPYAALCTYLDGRLTELRDEIAKREA